MTAANEAATLRRGGAHSFTESWNDAMDFIASNSAALTRSQPAGAAP